MVIGMCKQIDVAATRKGTYGIRAKELVHLVIRIRLVVIYKPYLFFSSGYGYGSGSGSGYGSGSGSGYGSGSGSGSGSGVDQPTSRRATS